ncbi:hypothetical protein [Methylobacterium sp. ID0610]|uniref:hypothetical protein n=1 Tax=Methylobacterium carpenticola TaxID=3344827 RepID=UPI0036A96EF7
MRKRPDPAADDPAQMPARARDLMAHVGEQADDAIVIETPSEPPLTEAARIELRILRAAAAAIDLQRVVGPHVERMASVQAMIDAAWAVFAELGRGGPGAEDTVHH